VHQLEFAGRESRAQFLSHCPPSLAVQKENTVAQ